VADEPVELTPQRRTYRPTPEHLKALEEGRIKWLAKKEMKRKEVERTTPRRPIPPKFPTKAEREQELSRLEPRAIEVLEAQLESDDERIAQAAAKMLLEHKWGRPTQRQEVQQEVTQIEYVTTAATQWRRTPKPA